MVIISTDGKQDSGTYKPEISKDDQYDLRKRAHSVEEALDSTLVQKSVKTHQTPN